MIIISIDFLKKNKMFKVFWVIIVIAILVICIYFAIIIIMKTYFYPTKYFDIVKEEAKNNNIDPYLVLAIIKTESNFKKDALSNKNAKGLMQILESTANEVNNSLSLASNIDNTNIYDEKVNIAIGTKYFSNLVKKYDGNYYLAICAYNAGMGNVDKWIKDEKVPSDLNVHKDISIPFKQTENYLYKVMNSYKIYRYLYK